MRRNRDQLGLVDLAHELTPFERSVIAFTRATFDQPHAHLTVQWLQRNIGARWILAATSNVRRIHGVERLPTFDRDKSYICVANHRSFFDLYVVTAMLVASGLRHRIVFPVRSNFFYDHPLGPFVNATMSFFAMYPPIFRDRHRAALNVASLNDLTHLLRRGGTFAGLHPEGTRKKDDDPYTFLPAQPGVGRVIYRSRATVLPVFINGLLNDLVAQVSGNFRRTIPDVHVVFGAPLDVDDLLLRAESPRVHREISERALQVIGKLGEEERQIRGGA